MQSSARAALLAAIEAHFDTHGTAPSMRELVAAGLASSTSHAQAHCRALVKAGLLHAGGRGEARRFVPAWAVGVRGHIQELEARVEELKQELDAWHPTPA